MLKDALYYKDAFMRLKTSNRHKYAKITPNDDEWTMAITVFKCLKKFCDLTVYCFLVHHILLQIYYKSFFL